MGKMAKMYNQDDMYELQEQQRVLQSKFDKMAFYCLCDIADAYKKKEYITVSSRDEKALYILVDVKHPRCPNCTFAGLSSKLETIATKYFGDVKVKCAGIKEDKHMFKIFF